MAKFFELQAFVDDFKRDQQIKERERLERLNKKIDAIIDRVLDRVFEQQ